MIARLLVPKSSTLLLLTALLIGAQRAHAESDVANPIYRVSVADGASNIGSFTASTGPQHPAGDALSLLSGGDIGKAGTSFLSVRSYTTGTDYVQSDEALASGNLISSLDAYADLQPIGQTGYRTTYSLPGPPESAEALEIISDVKIVGKSYADSSIEFSVTVTNLDVIPISIGVRYLLDLQVAGDDGPVLEPVIPAGGPIVKESSFFDPAFAAIRAEDNDGSAPQLSVLTDLSNHDGGASGPDLVQYTYWPDASASAYDYNTSDRDIATPLGLDDGAMLVYFGATEDAATLLQPQESNTVTISMFATPPITGPEQCDNGLDDDGDRLTDDEDADCQHELEPSSTPARTPGSLPNTGHTSREHMHIWSLLVAAGFVLATTGLAMSARRRFRRD